MENLENIGGSHYSGQFNDGLDGQEVTVFLGGKSDAGDCARAAAKWRFGGVV